MRLWDPSISPSGRMSGMQLINVKALDKISSGKQDGALLIQKGLVGHYRFNQEFPDAYDGSCTLAYRPLRKVDGVTKQPATYLLVVLTLRHIDRCLRLQTLTYRDRCSDLCLQSHVFDKDQCPSETLPGNKKGHSCQRCRYPTATAMCLLLVAGDRDGFPANRGLDRYIVRTFRDLAMP